MGASAYNLYVNMQAQTTGLTGGLRSGATQLRQFDGQLQQVNRTLMETSSATQRLARLQASASADAVLGQARVTAAVQRTQAAQSAAAAAATRSGRAQALAANLAARAETERAAAVAAGERTLRAQAVAQNMAARAQAATGRGAVAAQATAAAAARAATQAAQAQALQEERAAAAQAAAARGAALATRTAQVRQAADARALTAVAAQSEAEAAAAARAAANAAAVRQAQAAADAEARAATQARTAGYLRSGAVLSAVLAAGVLQAAALEKRMANVMTISKEINATTVNAFTDRIVSMSTGLTQSANQLAEGLYQIVSTGFDGSDAMTILNVAAQGASAGLTTTETSARALLGVLKAYGLTAGDATNVMDIMFQTVNKGVISFEELAQQLGDVVPMAAAAGVPFDDLSAALATITLAGVPAAESATALNMMLTRMMRPTRELSDAMHSLGYESAASAVQQDGLYVVVNKLVNATHGQAESITGLFHDVRASRAVLALAANDGKNYADSYQGIANEVERAGATQKAFQLQVNTTSGQWSMFVNRSKALGIDLGRALLPVMQTVGNALSVFAGALADAPGPLKDLGAGLLAVSAGGMLALAAITRVTRQLAEFRAAQTAAREGGALLPVALKGAGLAVSGLTALLTVGVLAYAAYSASKEKAKQATDDLVEALRRENEEGQAGAGIRALTEQLTSGDFASKMKAAGVEVTDAVDAVASGGSKLQGLLLQLQAKSTEYALKVKSGKAPGNTDDIRNWDDAAKALTAANGRWNKAVKQEAAISAQMEIVNAKVLQAKAGTAEAWTLDFLVPPGDDGLPKYTDEMKAMAQALSDIVNPAKAWTDAQDKVAESNKNAKATLKDYLDQLRSQLKAQRDFQKNLTALAMAGYGDLTDHFAKLGATSAPILDELVKQLGKGKTKVADELQDIITESAARSQDAFRAGLDELPAIAARYGKKIAQKFADAAQTNDAGKFARVLQEMAVTDMSRAVKKGSAAARAQMQTGMRLLAQVAEKKGADAATALQRAFLSGDVTTAMDQLRAIWGANLPISEKDLQGVVAAFKTAGAQSLSEWSAMLQLIQQVAKAKGSAAAAALTSALLSGDMAAVQSQLDAIGVSVREIPGTKTISVSVDPPAPVSVTVIPRIGAGPLASKPQFADGGLLSFYAEGGVRRESHIAQIAPAGSWRVWAEPETYPGEAYIPLAPSKRARSKQILDEVAHRFGATVEYHAEGGLSGWSYTPAGGTDGVISLSSIASDSMNSKGTGLNLNKFAKNLHQSVKEARQWRKDLTTVARRAGQDVADALEAMGADGIALTHKMARGSSKYINSMSADLKKLAETAKASLSDFTSQLGSATKDTSEFQKNLAKLAAEGYGDLASRLAAQGDQAAQDLAAEAVKSKKNAAKANQASKAASATLSDEDLADLLTIISAIKKPTTGIHQVAEATKLGEDRIIEVANAGKAQLSKALGKKADRFLADLGRANKGLSYEWGGVLTPGLYATSNGLIRFAEPSTGGEAYIPLGQAKRPSATQVLEDVAHRFGYTLTAQGVSGPTRVDAHPPGGVQVVVVKETARPLIGHMPVTVTAAGDGNRVAQAMGAELMRRLRAAQRGGKL